MSKTTITAEPGIPQIVVTREFDAPRELVFRAHTDPDLLVQWLGPRDLTLTIDRYEVHPGTDRREDLPLRSDTRHLPVACGPLAADSLASR